MVRSGRKKIGLTTGEHEEYAPIRAENAPFALQGGGFATETHV